jgi:hypothetical protein
MYDDFSGKAGLNSELFFCASLWLSLRDDLCDEGW